MQSIDKIAELLKASGASEDEIMNLLETAVAEIKKDVKDDMIIDLKDFGQQEAAEIIKANY
jgi:nucleoid DNA-binding protein